MNATATAHANIALVKYWGKRDTALNLPAVPSLSLALDRFVTRTTVAWGAPADEVVLNGAPADEPTRCKVLALLDVLEPRRPPVVVTSQNSFPSGAGLASSSSGFAALVLAAAAGAGRVLSRAELSALARRGSGSACRSLWGGFVQWDLGTRADGADSHGVPLQVDWDVRMVVAVVSGNRTPVGSTDGMKRSVESPYWPTWVATAPADVATARDAILRRDIERLGEVMEASTFKMHAVMHTSHPPLLYWLPGTVGCLHAVAALRRAGTGAWATMDAGPNVKVLCLPADAGTVAAALAPHVDRVEILGPAPDPTVEVA
jgi:diphosphomevalonate decarboxylase